MTLSGKTAVVTGASSGIGAATARRLAAAGATVVLAARRLDRLEQLAAEIGAQAMPLAIDLAHADAAQALLDGALARHGRIDILVNNAGLGANHDALDVTEADWDQMMDVNLRGLFFLTQAVARGMVARRYGRIVHLSSQAGLVGIRRHAVYSASKGGVGMLTKVLALEWAPFGVTVNAVAPTFVRTPGTAARLDDPAFAADVLARIPVGRFGTTADVAGAVIYLASPAAGLVTGVTLPVDGGWTAQ